MASTATLATLRDRVLQQVTSAGSGMDHTPVKVSALTLTTMRDRVELALQDSTNAIWATGDIDEAITQALEQYSRHRPLRKIGTVTLAANSREIDISSLTNLIRVEKVWYPYDVAAPAYPPNWVHFETWPGNIIFITDPVLPLTDNKARIWYTEQHTLSGLEGAAATTFPIDDDAFLIDGAAAFATRFRALEIAETATVDDKVYARLDDWARDMMREFSEGLYSRGWKNYAFTYDQDDLDEAIRWALHRINEVAPDQYITTLTLAASGREVDISSITDYIDIIRVWWPYTAAAPERPPNWREFQQWPGDLLYVDDPDEPQTGDVVRLWYTRPHTLNGLDAATASTISLQDETLLVIGASGFVAQEYVQDTASRYVPRKLREWADARLKEFERGLKALARRQAARFSGIAAVPALDRWDNQKW